MDFALNGATMFATQHWHAHIIIRRSHYKLHSEWQFLPSIVVNFAVQFQCSIQCSEWNTEQSVTVCYNVPLAHDNHLDGMYFMRDDNISRHGLLSASQAEWFQIVRLRYSNWSIQSLFSKLLIDQWMKCTE